MCVHFSQKMAARLHFWAAVLQFLALIFQATFISSYQFKVADLHAWNLPSSSNPDIFAQWSKSHTFHLGDSLFFLYPPSQDSVLQVTPQSFKNCNLKNPILEMKDGNSLYNVTQPGEFYFISGAPGRCEKSLKLHISVAGNGSYAYPPAYGPDAADSPSYTPNFGGGGGIPAADQRSSSSPLISPMFLSAVTVLVMVFFLPG